MLDVNFKITKNKIVSSVVMLQASIQIFEFSIAILKVQFINGSWRMLSNRFGFESNQVLLFNWIGINPIRVSPQKSQVIHLK